MADTVWARISWGRRLLIAGLVFVALATAGLAYLLMQESEYRRIASPDGRYTAIASFRGYELLVPRFPGQAGDKGGSIRIEGVDGTDYGSIPVPMVSMIHDIRWEQDGAYLVAIGEWDFPAREYAYWNRAQTEKTVRRVK